MRVLVVAPHADDEVLGAGATMRRFADAGDTVRLLVLTHRPFPCGARTRVNPELNAREVSDVCRVLGAKSSLIAGFTQHHLLEQRQELIDLLEAERGTFRPHLVLFPDDRDTHQDHRVTFEACKAVWRPHLAQGVSLWAYQAPSAFGFVPDIYQSISERHLEAKCQALECYSSEQLPAPSSRSRAHLRAQATYWGGVNHLPLAEAFRHVMTAG